MAERGPAAQLSHDDHAMTATARAVDALAARLSGLTETVGHSEIFGVDLQTASVASKDVTDRPKDAESSSSTQLTQAQRLILLKYLKARDGDVERAAEALEKTLRWRKEFDPISAAFNHDDKGSHGQDASTFDGLAYVTRINEQVVVWNLHGPASKRPKEVFEPLDRYLRWRVGVQERAVALLDLNDDASVGSYNGSIENKAGSGGDAVSSKGGKVEDRLELYYGQLYTSKQGIQVHDYADVSLLRLDPAVRHASKALIGLMTDHYAETMRRTYFVNVPWILRALFGAISLMLSNETLAKLKVLASNADVAKELGLAEQVPVKYGGTATKSLAEMEREAMAPLYEKRK